METNGAGLSVLPTRRHLLLLLAAMTPLSGQGQQSTLLLLRSSDIPLLKQHLQAAEGPLAAERESLRKAADLALTQGPWSVTDTRPKDTPAGKNDYFSEGPYWWPDPAAPNGPYLRRDGEVNPDTFTNNYRDMSQLADAVLCLALAGALFSDGRYTERAWLLLRVWFVDAETRMNSNLEFGQAIRGRLWGRGIGLIDTVQLIRLIQGVMILETDIGIDRDVSHGLKAWFRDFLRWMTTSEKGIESRDNGNNHSTWWATQVATYATYLRDETSLLKAWTLFYESIIPKQFLANGSAPKEEERTKSLTYSAMNLDGLSILCRIGQMWQMDLWDFEAENGASPAKAVAYLLPYWEKPSNWTHPQLEPTTPSRALFPCLAGWGLGEPSYVDRHRKIGCTGNELARLLRLLMALPA